MDLQIYLNRKFTRHDNPSIGSPNPDADPLLVAMLADANDNGATTEGVTVDGLKLVKVSGIGQDEVSKDLAHYIANLKDGCDVLNANSCKAIITFDDLDAFPDASIVGYVPAEEEQTWGEIVASPTVFHLEANGVHHVQAGLFLKSGTQLTASQHLAMSVAGVSMIHPDDLPQDEISD